MCQLKMTLMLSALGTCLISVFSSVTGEHPLKKVILGNHVTLYCNGQASLHDEFEVMWKTPNQLVAKFSKGHLSYGPGFENRVRFENVHKGELTFKQFSLHINPTVFSDTDIYSCFSGADLIKTWNLVVTVTPPKEVEVIERGTVKLPCYSLIDRQLPNDRLSVQWWKDGKVVLNLTVGTTYHYPDLDYRANIFLDEIRKGDFSLEIKNTQMTDEGNYDCFVKNAIVQKISSVKFHVIKGIHHGYRERVLRYEGDYFTFFVSTNNVEIHLVKAKIGVKKPVCEIKETGAHCHVDVSERIAIKHRYLTLNNLSKNDEGIYTVVDIIEENTLTEIILEVKQNPFIGKFQILPVLLVGFLFFWFIRRKIPGLH